MHAAAALQLPSCGTRQSIPTAMCVLSSPTTCPAGVEALPPAEVEALVGSEVRARLAGRVRWEHVAAYEVLSQPFRWAQHESCTLFALGRALSAVVPPPCGQRRTAAGAAGVYWVAQLGVQQLGCGSAPQKRPDLPPPLICCSFEDGTLTRTMKPRRDAIRAKCAAAALPRTWRAKHGSRCLSNQPPGGGRGALPALPPFQLPLRAHSCILPAASFCAAGTPLRWRGWSPTCAESAVLRGPPESSAAAGLAPRLASSAGGLGASLTSTHHRQGRARAGWPARPVRLACENPNNRVGVCPNLDCGPCPFAGPPACRRRFFCQALWHGGGGACQHTSRLGRPMPLHPPYSGTLFCRCPSFAPTL